MKNAGFRSILFASIAVLVALVIGFASLAVVLVIQRRAEHALAIEMQQVEKLVASVFAARVSQLQREIRVVAQEPRLKAVVATEEVDHETVLGVATELAKTAMADLFIIVDGEGKLLADVANPEQDSWDLSDNPLVRRTMAQGDDASIWSDERRTYLVAARRLHYGAQVVGVVLEGYALDDAFANALATTSQSAVVFAREGRIVARAGVAQTDSDLLPMLSRPDGLLSVSLGGSSFLARKFALPAVPAGTEARAIVLRSLDEALAPTRQLIRVLLAILVVGVLLAMAAASALASTMSRPLEALAADARRIGNGELEVRAQLAGPAEVRALGAAMNEMTSMLEVSRRNLIVKERLEREMEIAQRIQTSLLPPAPSLPGMEISTLMLPASEVGGDYFDIVAREDGGWIGIGDVAGHGLPSGVVMLMVQSAVSTLCGPTGEAVTPPTVVQAVNRVIYENVHTRMKQDEHVTFSIIRYLRDGWLEYSGAHEQFIVAHSDGNVERLPTTGTWIGAVPDVSAVTPSSRFKLVPGDVLLLYSDGLIEPMNNEEELLGIERIEKLLQQHYKDPVEKIRDVLVKAALAWAAVQADDISLVIIRYTG